MRALSKEAEQKLIGAIEKAAALVNDGVVPTDAIIKSAREHDIPAGHINLMVHAYNTGRTTTQREKGESTLEKAAEFLLADGAEVLKALYPETVKSSSAIRRAAVVSTDYALSVVGMLTRRRDGLQKTAAAQVPLPAKTWVPPSRDERGVVLRAQSEKMAALRVEEEKRRLASAAYSKAASSLEDLNTYFRTPGNMSFEDAVREVGLRFGDTGVSVLQKVAAVYPHFTKQAVTKTAHFGNNPLYELVQNVLKSVAEYNSAQNEVSPKKAEAFRKIIAPKNLTKLTTGSILADDEPLKLKEAVTKKKADDAEPFQPIPPANQKIEELAKRYKNVDSSPTPEFDAVMEDITFNEQLDNNRAEAKARNAEQARRDMLEQASQFEANERSVQQDAQQAERRVQQEAQQTAAARKENFKNFETGAKTLWKDFDGGLKDIYKNNTITGPAKFIGGILGAKDFSALSPVKEQDSKGAVREQYQKLTDPGHENALKTIRAKSVVHDMVLNDPVISGYDPQDVAMAFNEIAELAPSLIDTPGMIRPLLRKRLEAGQLADFDVKQILEMDKLRADRDKVLLETKDKTLNLL